MTRSTESEAIRLNARLNSMKSARAAGTHARRLRRAARLVVTLAERAGSLKQTKRESVRLATVALRRYA
jgi:hypothetical protein